jgi:hypothetical protein
MRPTGRPEDKSGQPAGAVERELDIDPRPLELARRDDHLFVRDRPERDVRVTALERASLMQQPGSQLSQA